MYKIYKTSRGGLSTLKKPSSNCWIDVNSPTLEDLEDLKKYVEIPEDVLVSVKDIDEVPKIEELDDFKFILIQTPHNNEEVTSGNYSVKPLGIMYNQDYVITITDGKNDVMDYLRTKLKNFHNNKIIDTGNTQQLILKLILFSAKIYLRYLKFINNNIYTAQIVMEKSTENDDIIGLMDLAKSLAYFDRSIRSNYLVAEKLAKKKYFSGTEENEELIQDVLDENKQAIDMVKIYERILSDTANTFTSIISNNLNKTVKFLTAITIILMLPTLLVSIYGMNVALPYQDEPHAFAMVMGIGFILSLILIIWFYRRKLF